MARPLHIESRFDDPVVIQFCFDFDDVHYDNQPSFIAWYLSGLYKQLCGKAKSHNFSKKSILQATSMREIRFSFTSTRSNKVSAVL